MIGFMTVVQDAADLAGRLEWIAWAQTATAISLVLLALFGIGLAIAGFYMLRAAIRLLRTLEQTVDRLAPLAEPILERAGKVAEDAAGISERVRQNVDEFNDTLEDLNRQLREAVRAAEARVRRFGTVVDTVQAEVEDVLLDAAATARGLHAAAKRLRSPRSVADRDRRAAADDD